MKVKTRGLTLAEIVVAMGVLAAVSLVIVAIFTKLLMSSTKSSDQTTANLLARSILDRAVREGPDGWQEGRTFYSSGGDASYHTNSTAAETKFTYELEFVRLTVPSGGFGNLYEVTVVVSWWAEPSGFEAGRQEAGRTSVKVTRTLYLRE